MNRRRLLKNTVLAGLGMSLPTIKMQARTAYSIENTASGGFKKLKLGDLNLTILTDGHLPQAPIQPVLAPNAPKAELEKILTDNFRSVERVDMAVNVLLVEAGNRKILLDTGAGVSKMMPTAGHLRQSLRLVNIDPKSITDIIVSHAHPDHIGGLLDEQGNTNFPNAVLHISKIEFDFWMRATMDDFKECGLYQLAPEAMKTVVPQMKDILLKLKSNIRFIDLAQPLLDIFHFQLEPGHTPGMTLTRISSGGEQLAYFADLLHHDLLQFAHPEWTYAGDTLPALAVTSRHYILEQLSSSKMLAFSSHLPWPGLGHVAKDGNGFKWIPEIFMMP